MPTPSPQAALITGAAHRIGKAIALDLAGRGWAVAVHYHRSQEAADNLVAQIADAGGKATAVQADLSNAGETARLVATAAEHLGPLTCLVNNASLFEHDDVRTLTEDTWNAHIDTNLKAPAFLAHAFANQLPKGAGGNIINLIDQRVWRLNPRFLSYTISKSGLWTLTRTLAQALAPDIRVNGIGPGPTLANDRQSREEFERQSRATILGRGANAEEICEALRFILASPAMTGQMIALDGGQHLAWETPDIVGITE